MTTTTTMMTHTSMFPRKYYNHQHRIHHTLRLAPNLLYRWRANGVHSACDHSWEFLIAHDGDVFFSKATFSLWRLSKVLVSYVFYSHDLHGDSDLFRNHMESVAGVFDACPER